MALTTTQLLQEISQLRETIGKERLNGNNLSTLNYTYQQKLRVLSNAKKNLLQSADNQKKTQEKSALLALFSKKESSASKLTQILTLIKDGLDKKLMQELQEAINNAELSLQINNLDAQNPDSRKTLDFHIRVTATMIDKYAELLEMLLQKMPQKEVQSAVVQAKKDLNNHVQLVNEAIICREKIDKNERLKREELVLDLKKLQQACAEYLEEHEEVNCFSFWCPFSKKPGTHQQYAKLLAWLEGFSENALTTGEIIGGVYYAQKQVGTMENRLEAAALRDCLDKILKKQNHKIYQKEDPDIGKYINLFLHRADEISLELPLNGVLPDPKAQQFTNKEKLPHEGMALGM